MPATIAPGALPIERDGGILLVPIVAAAQAAGWEAKVVTAGKLVTLCRAEVCVPLRLDQVRHKEISGALYADAKALAKAMGVDFREEHSKGVFSAELATPAAEPAIPAYHAAWGKERGFRKGQTVPDIPLYDLDNKEVRFSKFLGKQYLIYVWASW